MSAPAEEAASQLRAIRALMERSTIYRAISAPAAAFAGVLSLAVCAWLWMHREPGERPDPMIFLCIWLSVLLVVSALNTWLLYRSAQQRGEVFVSAGMKHALRALAPPLTAGFIMSLLEVFAEENSRLDCYANIAAYWILFYGLALLATGSFSPRSMQALGGGFFAFGVLTFLSSVRNFTGSKYDVAVIHMAFSFGVLHLIYAAAVWIQSRRENNSAPPGA
ncbi:MAG TPA: hypothetical protein VG796_09640 [Verrucomicrobiales bacterium]|nr:hypothetical protein [Verrucomicrobiales bacterium]